MPRRGKTPLDPDCDGFIYSNPMETSFKQRCLEDWKAHHRKLLKMLRNEGLAALGDASESDYFRVEERLRKIIRGPDRNVLKPKAASKMIVSELKDELEAQGLPIDGTRNVLYQRVQKARRINRSRGRPLWVPPVEEEEEEVSHSLKLFSPFLLFSIVLSWARKNKKKDYYSLIHTSPMLIQIFSVVYLIFLAVFSSSWFHLIKSACNLSAG